MQVLKDAPWVIVQRRAGRYRGNRSFSVPGRQRQECGRRCALGSAGPCIRRGSRLPAHVPLAWDREVRRQDRRARAVGQVRLRAGQVSVTSRAA
jgi:hypothetical protein